MYNNGVGLRTLKMIKDLQDTILITKLSSGDLIAIEAKYYNCLSTYKN